MEDWVQRQRRKGHAIQDPLTAILEERGDRINGGNATA
jgi:hypothetical protein